MKRLTCAMALLLLSSVSGTAMADDEANKVSFNNHCRTCHSFKKGDNRLGPSMYGIVGSTAGQVEGFRGYSGGLKGFVWDEATLDRFIASPTSVSTSTSMIYPPVSDAAERARIIAYLKSISAP